MKMTISVSMYITHQNLFMLLFTHGGRFVSCAGAVIVLEVEVEVDAMTAAAVTVPEVAVPEVALASHAH